MKKILCVTVAALSLASLAGCNGINAALSASPLVLRTVVGTVDPYFHGTDIDGARFDKVGKRVYSYQWNWYRNLVIVTGDGLVVIDPMNARMAAGLRQELDRAFPGMPVHTLIYSHYHLDHTRGGAALAPRHVLAHEK